MGFLAEGSTLDWPATSAVSKKIKVEGLKQLLHIFAINRNREDFDLRWGDEIEFTLLHLDRRKGEARLCIDGMKVLKEAEEREKRMQWDDFELIGHTARLLSGTTMSYLRGATWHPEFARHMVEATPNPPYEFNVDSLRDVEDSMVSRRYKLQSILPPDVYVCTLTAFPRMGVDDFMYSSDPALDITDSTSTGRSEFITDNFVGEHPRFRTMIRSFLGRREGVAMQQFIPIYQDNHTQEALKWISDQPSFSDLSSLSRRDIIELKKTDPVNPVKDAIFMDHFGFGMGMCCLQMTFGAPNLESARNLYDQMANLAPIFLALSSATPFLRGCIADNDTRWSVLEQGSDCRREDEVDEVRWTRYSPVCHYIGQGPYVTKYRKELNDLDIPINHHAFSYLKFWSMDEELAKHYAHLWLRDPLVVYSDKIELDPATHSDHFENIQSTNWNSVRFKPPPPSPDGKRQPAIGWRVELRTPDLQMSDFANAALASISALLAQAIVFEGWNFYTPISQTHDNMRRAHTKGAYRSGRFHFRTQIIPTEENDLNSVAPKEAVHLMSLREIFLGSRRFGFEGLLPMLDRYVSCQWRNQRCSTNAVEKYRFYSNFIRLRVLGQIPSDADVLRQMVMTHPLYEGDSIITKALNYEICKMAVIGGFSLAEAMRPSRHHGCHSMKNAWIPCPAFSSLAEVPLVKSLLSLPESSICCGSELRLPDYLRTVSGDNRSTDSSDYCKMQGDVKPLRCRHGKCRSAKSFDVETFLSIDEFSR